MYLLDTNIISYSLYHPENRPYLMEKVRTVKPSDQYVSIVTAQELLNGRLQALAQSTNQKHARILDRYRYFQETLNDVLRKLQIVPFDAPAQREYEKIPAGVRASVFDKRIAGTAIANQFILVTANVQHFKGIPNLVIQDWTARPLE